MMIDTADNPAHREVALPLGPLLTAAWAPSAVVGAAWVAAALALGAEPIVTFSGLAGAGLVAAVATAALFLLQPWVPKPLYRWPAVWIGTSFLRMVMALGITFLLYSATPLRGRWIWFAVVTCYGVTLVGETRVYAKLMKRLAPPGAPRSASE